jgi:GAF domain-containing protein
MNKYDILQNVNRLLVMRDLALLDAAEEPFFDRLTRFASNVIGVPVSLVSLVSNNYQFFKSATGLPEPWASDRRTPLSHSFCQHVVATGKPLVVTDARLDARLKENLAIPDLNVIGYLGIPLRTEDGKQLGSFCVIDDKPHNWTESDIEVMTAFAALVNAEIDARVVARNNGTLRQHIKAASAGLNAFMGTINADLPRADIITKLKNYTDTVRNT